MGILQRELDEVVREWNTHRIRPNHHSRTPLGIPDRMFFIPELEGLSVIMHYDYNIVPI